jgi:hypothetical protein
MNVVAPYNALIASRSETGNLLRWTADILASFTISIASPICLGNFILSLQIWILILANRSSNNEVRIW